MHLLTCYLSWTTCRSGESTSNFRWLQNYTGRTVVLSGLEVISEYAQMDEQFSSAMPERRRISLPVANIAGSNGYFWYVLFFFSLYVGDTGGV